MGYAARSKRLRQRLSNFQHSIQTTTSMRRIAIREKRSGRFSHGLQEMLWRKLVDLDRSIWTTKRDGQSLSTTTTKKMKLQSMETQSSIVLMANILQFLTIQ